MTTVRFDPNYDVNQLKVELASAGDSEIDRAPVDKAHQQAAGDEARKNRRHPPPIELGELLTGHLAVGERKLAVVRIAGHVPDVGDIVRRIGQHQLRPFAVRHQPVVKRFVARIALRETVFAQRPNVAEVRDRRRERLRRRRLIRGEVLVVVQQRQAVDLGHLEAGLNEIDAEDHQLLEFDPQRLGVPGAGFAEPVQRDAQRAQFGLVEVIDDDAGDLCDAVRFGRLQQPMALDDSPFAVNQDGLTQTKPCDARGQLRDLLGIAPPDLP